MDLKFEKSVWESIQKIDFIREEKACKIIDNQYTINNSISLIQYNEQGGFECKIFLEKLHNYEFNQNIEKFGIQDEIILDCTGYKFSIEKQSIKSLKNTLGTPQVLTLGLTNFRAGIEDDYLNKKYRLVIPIENEPTLSIMEVKPLKIDDTITFAGIIPIKIGLFEFHLFTHKNKDTGKSYLFIDSLHNHDFNEFELLSNAIITSFGFISGNLYLGRYYYLTYNDNRSSGLFSKIAFKEKEKSIITNKSLFDPSDFAYYLDKLNHPQKDQFPLHMTFQCFSNLCTKVYDDKTFARCCIQILEGNNSKRYLLQSAIYSIALEAMTNIIYVENEKKINPIEDMVLSDKIREKLKTIIDEYEEQIGDYGMAILNAKIENINSPTNTKKLSKPFELYNIQLSKDDTEILGHRNKFLHGTSPFEEEKLEEKHIDLVFISSRLHFLLCTLMLKHIGYSGHILYYPTIVQINSKRKVTDHMYKLI